MSRDREEVMTVAMAIAHAHVGKRGLPDESQIRYTVTEYFDLAEAIVDERDRRYPAKKDA